MIIITIIQMMIRFIIVNINRTMSTSFAWQSFHILMICTIIPVVTFFDYICWASITWTKKVCWLFPLWYTPKKIKSWFRHVPLISAFVWVLKLEAYAGIRHTESKRTAVSTKLIIFSFFMVLSLKAHFLLFVNNVFDNTFWLNNCYC